MAHLLPLPPLSEQKRIVDSLDRLSGRIDRGRTALDHVPTLVEQCKSKILSLAFAGRLTADIRETGTIDLPNGNGYPSGWVARSLGEIAEIQGGIQVGKRRSESVTLVDVPYLRVANVQRGWLKLDEIKTLQVTPSERDRLLLQNGDILMNEGGDRDKLGRGWVWESQIAECIHQNHVFRVRLFDRSFPSKYVSHYANAKGQEYFFQKGTQSTNLASIGKRKLAAFTIPIPQTVEAREIVDRIESIFGWLDRVLTHYESASALLPSLEAAIHRTAFRGELLSQNPEDEPASALLARMVATRELEKPPSKRPEEAKSRETKSMARSLEEVLIEEAAWMPAQEAFRRCGIADGSETDAIEVLYSELRTLDKAGRLMVEAVTDDTGRKL